MMRPPHADFVEAEIAYRREFAGTGGTGGPVRPRLVRAVSQWGRQWILGRHRPALSLSPDVQLRATNHN
jgi:hypothetical protein